ncbi:hypothetical protein ASPZODRAFT_164819 [Penicilliopsis zonata CBS 506.65]|uniref:NB-ARC domain-containing protein n=1 Tax=Penicilliopsis zonata CBS 506.65 TaxID=1073090 RepID=A0A1L9SPW2_9EURO|nr:hypothetical protein ASPZODRAFT_164819 [Penicilliopsis zonata CBS 506.65]OJJ49289.1 hypothetical protein ASPZODRAFT_164819 [Penicilliopsis zonata CBS 506.65]
MDQQHQAGDLNWRLSAHPITLLFFLGFRIGALLMYLFGVLFIRNFVLVFILTLLLLSADFYYLKNIAGRRLVGLRWWNEVNTATGDSHWVFESSDPNVRTINATDKRFFWLSLYATPALWIGLAVLAIVTLSSVIWLSLVAIALVLTITNTVAFSRCDRFGQASTFANRAFGGSLINNIAGGLLDSCERYHCRFNEMELQLSIPMSQRGQVGVYSTQEIASRPHYYFLIPNKHTNMASLTHCDYTVAWICALPLELAAAKAMLDKIHDPLPQPPTDHNIYTLGTVSGHNVIVACLPAGVYGTISASTVVSHITSTFPGVRFGLMVGIGGGVPGNAADIRLGDVVVSQPTGLSTGVIQYDYGKALYDGQFQRTGSLNKPPPVLLKAVSQMQSDCMTGKNPVNKIMTDILQSNHALGEQFSRPESDWLFKPTYLHKGGSLDCSGCDQKQLVNRAPRAAGEHYIHPGLIASGDQVIKDAKLRDSIAQEVGILCFEMEAAGLMDELPSLVIRGICDYCDSHKHKKWQGYAALTAAAYAKALLILVPKHHRAESMQDHTKRAGHWMIPFGRNPRFVGRQDVIAKVEQLIQQQDGNGLSKVAICGLGGVGKTQVALELAYRMRERDPERSIFWIPCTSDESVEQAYTSMTQILGMHDVKPAEAKDRIKGYLSKEHAGKWLLVFDNADDYRMWIRDSGDATTSVLRYFIPQSENGCILFTSRNRKLAVKLVNQHVIPVHSLDQRTAADMLKRSLIQSSLIYDSYETTLNLLDQLTYLPLAITQAAAYINENDIGLADYIALLQEQEPDVIELLSENFEDEGRYAAIQNPVASTWLISFQHIQQLNALAVEHLLFMACINPRDIPQSLLPQSPSQKKRVDALGLLKAYSFITEQTSDHSLYLHRLVHLATRNWMRQDQRFSLQTSKTAQLLWKALRDVVCNENRKLWRRYLPHALFLVGDNEFQNQQEDNAAKPLDQSQWMEAEEVGLQLLKAQKQILGLEHDNTLTSMHNLVITQMSQGKWEEAEEMNIQLLETQKQVLGLEHYKTLTSMHKMAIISKSLGKAEAAISLMAECVRLRKRYLHPDDPDTSRSTRTLNGWQGMSHLSTHSYIDDFSLETP